MVGYPYWLGVSLPTATRFIAVDTGSSRSGGWWRGGEATVGVVPDVALADAEVVQLAAHAKISMLLAKPGGHRASATWSK